MTNETLGSVVYRPVASCRDHRIEVPAQGSFDGGLHPLAVTSCFHDLSVGAFAL
jgi:hypothetical protein